MLRLRKHEYYFFGGGAVNDDIEWELYEACDIKQSFEINSEYSLEFDYPHDGKYAENIILNRLVICEGQNYFITKISKDNTGKTLIHVSCTHEFHTKARRNHVQSFGGTQQTIGVPPVQILAQATASTTLTQLTQEETEALGMVRIGDKDGFLIDFDTVDKTTTYDIIQQVIKNCGKGELYIDNNKYALVERIGTDRGLRLDTAVNMKNVTVERDITNMITKLYAYGKDDAHIGSVNNNNQYIISENSGMKYLPSGKWDKKSGFGLIAGYKDYSEYSEPSDIMAHAQWDFSPENPDRIDVPDINISGNIVDLSKISKGEPVEVGDGVTVIDGGEEIKERIIKIEKYPYEPKETRVSIGRIKKDLFFYLNQLGRTTKEYGTNSTSNGKVRAKSVSGSIGAAQTSQTASVSNSVSNASGGISLSITAAAIEIKNGNYRKFFVGAKDGKFVFELYDNQATPEKAISISDGVLEIYGEAVK